MSTTALTWAFAQRTGSAARKAVLVALADQASDHDYSCYPGQESIALRTELGQRTVRREVKALEDMGFLTREHRKNGQGRTSDRYLLAVQVTVGNHTPPPPPLLPPSSTEEVPATVAATDSGEVPATQAEVPATQAGGTGHSGQGTVREPLVNRQGVNARTRAKRTSNSQKPSDKSTAATTGESQPALPSLPANVTELKPKPTRKTRLPEGWRPGEDLIRWQRENDYPDDLARTETVKFIDYWRGRGTPMADWDATWRNWIRRAAEDRVRFARRSAGPAQPAYDPEQRTEW